MWLRSLQAHGRVARGWLGVEIQAITPEMAASLGSKDLKGAIVANVVPGGPAQKAGFHQGDLVVRNQRHRSGGSRDLTRRVAALQAGTTCDLHSGAGWYAPRFACVGGLAQRGTGCVE